MFVYVLSATTCIGSSEHVGELFLSFHSVGPGHEAQGVRLATEHSYPSVRIS